MLKMTILPLILSNVITGTASLGAKSNGKMGAINVAYVVITNIIGCILAIILTIAIKPGTNTLVGSDDGGSQSSMSAVMKTEDIFADLLRNLFPENIVEATLSQIQTTYKRVDKTELINTSEGLSNETVVTMERIVGTSSGSNLLGLIIVAILFGLAASLNPGRGKPFVQFFTSTGDLVLIIIRWFLWYSPIGITSLMIKAIASIDGDLTVIFTKLGMFIITVTTGLVIHQLIILPLILFAVTRRNPFKFYISLARAWMTAFATTSGAMAIPDLFKACEEKNKIDKRVTRFVIPFTVTLNADGSALFIVSAAMFIAQLNGIVLDGGQIAVLGDRLRTTSNVVSHGFAVPIVYTLCKSEFSRSPDVEQNEVELEYMDKETKQITKNTTEVTFALE